MKFKKYYTDTDNLTSFPALIQASGEPLVDYTIYGNTGGVGDYILLPNAAENNVISQTINGLTITVNGDIFTVNGTATSTTSIQLYSGKISDAIYPKDYQEIVNGIYKIDGNPLDAAVDRYIISYRYDNDVSSPPPSQKARVPVGSAGTLDNTGGAYRYIAIYIAIWQGVECNNVVFNPTLRREAYEIPISSGGVTTNLYIDSPLGLTDTLTYTDTGIAIPTFDGDNTISFGTTVQPSAMSAEYKGWHSQDTVRVYNGNTWD